MLREMHGLQYPSDIVSHFVTTQERILRRVQFPKTAQLFDYMTVDEHNRAWLQLSSIGSSYVRNWLVVDLATGRVVDRLRVPHRASVVAASVLDDRLIVIESTPDQIARLAMYGR